MAKKKAVGIVHVRPINWLEETPPEQIGEALLAVDRVKAARVVAYLLKRVEPEVKSVVDDIRVNIEEDPLGTLGRALIGMGGRGR